MRGRFSWLLVVIALASCRSSSADVPRTTVSPDPSVTSVSGVGSALESRSFKVATISQSGAERPVVFAEMTDVSFRQPVITVTTGCSRITGTGFIAADGVVSLLDSQREVTDSRCDGRRAAQDSLLQQALLLPGTRFDVSGDSLTIVTSDGVQITATDRHGEEVQTKLPPPGPEGNWVLLKLLKVDVAPPVTPVRLVLGVDGSFTLTGCTSVTGSFTMANGSAVFTPEPAVGGPCATVEERAAELAYLSVFEGTVAAKLGPSGLLLTVSGGVGALFMRDSVEPPSTTIGP